MRTAIGWMEARHPAPGKFYEVNYVRLSRVILPASQQNSKVATCKVGITNTVRDETSNYAIHLPDNGF